MSRRIFHVGPTREPSFGMKWWESSIDIDMDGKLYCDIIIVRGKTREGAKQLRAEVIESLEMKYVSN